MRYLALLLCLLSAPVLAANGNGNPSGNQGNLPAGSSGQVQYNSSGVFGASSNLFWDISNARLGIGTATPQAALDVGGLITAVTGGMTAPVALFSTNSGSVSGVEFANINTGSGSDFRFVISDSPNNTNADYIALTMPSTGNSSTWFGQTRSNTAGIIGNTVSGTKPRILTLGTINATDLILGTSNTDRLHILSTGNIGIGSVTPSAILDVAGGTQTTNVPAISFVQTWNNGATVFNGIYGNVTNTASSGSSNLLNLQIAGVTQFRVNSLGNALGNAFIPLSATTPGGGLGMYLSAANTIGFATNSAGVMAIGVGVSIGTTYFSTAAPTNGGIIQGNVGIGTTTPGNKLDVNGAATIGFGTGVVASSNGLMVGGNVGIGGVIAPVSNLTLGFGGANTFRMTTGVDRFLITKTDITGTDFSENYGNFTFDLAVVNGGSPVEVMRLAQTGNVGIGTNAPGNKLDISGALAIGTSYVGTAAPTNGAIIQGNVGIGTTNPLSLLSIGTTNQFQVNTAGSITSTGTLVAGGTVLQSGSGLTMLTSLGATNKALSIDTNGIVWLGQSGSALSTTNYAFFQVGSSLNINSASGYTNFNVGNTAHAKIGAGIGIIGVSDCFFMTHDGTIGSVSVVHMCRDADFVAGFRDPTNGVAQAIQIWGSSTTGFATPVNGQNLLLDADIVSNMARVAGNNIGTGAPMGLQFGVAKTTGGGVTNIANFATSGHLLWNTASTYDVGSLTNGPGNVYAGKYFVPNSADVPTCGSGCSSITGNDQKFVVTTGVAQTSITVNFGHTWAATPVCTISSNSTASVVDISSTSASAITFGASVALTGSTINALCF